jgi:hypothetical protein
MYRIRPTRPYLCNKHAKKPKVAKHDNLINWRTKNEIHSWGTKKGKKNSRICLSYFLQITFTWNKLKQEKLNNPI